MTAEIDLEASASIAAALGQVGAQLEMLNGHHRRERERRAELNASMMPLNIDLQVIPLSGGAGTLDVPRLLGPPMGWVWQLDGLGAQGFTAGTVTVYLNSTAGVQLLTFTAAGAFYQRHFRFMRYGERLLFGAAGITGTPAVWLSGLAFTEAIQGEALL